MKVKQSIRVCQYTFYNYTKLHEINIRPVSITAIGNRLGILNVS